MLLQSVSMLEIANMAHERTREREREKIEKNDVLLFHLIKGAFFFVLHLFLSTGNQHKQYILCIFIIIIEWSGAWCEKNA